MTIPNNTPNTTFNRTTPNDGLLFADEFSRLYANDNSIQSQVNALEIAYDPQDQLSNSPNWTSPSTSIAPSAKALDARAKSLFPIKRFSGWLADFWIQRGTTIASSHWLSICWSPELHLFVVVGTGSAGGNNVLTSSNGIHWLPQTGPALGDLSWNSVCWSSELHLFVAVAAGSGTGNRVMISPDGINWTFQTGGAGCQWLSVCWSPELHIFVAVGQGVVSNLGTGNKIITSPNGVDWTTQTSPGTINWASVCWSSALNLFVAVGPGATLMKSSDGINWASVAAASSTWSSVCWSPELAIFVAVSFFLPGVRIMTSSNGTTWTVRLDVTIPGELWLYSVCWSAELNLFIGVSQGPSGSGSKVLSSPDGINWTFRTGNPNMNSVCWSPELGMFAAVGYNDSIMTCGTGLGKGYLG